MAYKQEDKIEKQSCDNEMIGNGEAICFLEWFVGGVEAADMQLTVGGCRHTSDDY